MDHAGRLEFCKQRVQRGAVADIRTPEDVARVVSQVGQRFEVAGVGKLVDVDHTPVCFGNQLAYQRRADETGATCDKEGFHGIVWKQIQGAERQNCIRKYRNSFILLVRVFIMKY